jgi:hypothetical protein
MVKTRIGHKEKGGSCAQERAHRACGCAFGIAAQAQQAPVSPSPVKRTPIGKSEVPNSNYEVITAMVEIVPGFRAGWHSHPGIVQAQVLEGEFMLALDGHLQGRSIPRTAARCDSQRRRRRRQAGEADRDL